MNFENMTCADVYIKRGDQYKLLTVIASETPEGVTNFDLDAKLEELSFLGLTEEEKMMGGNIVEPLFENNIFYNMLHKYIPSEEVSKNVNLNRLFSCASYEMVQMKQEKYDGIMTDRLVVSPPDETKNHYDMYIISETYFAKNPNPDINNHAYALNEHWEVSSEDLEKIITLTKSLGRYHVAEIKFDPENTFDMMMIPDSPGLLGVMLPMDKDLNEVYQILENAGLDIDEPDEGEIDAGNDIEQ